MRIQQLNLLRYGRFTDQLLSFPHARRDFHFVIGGNEAGKSTTRSAILDLLYSIDPRTTFDFLHAKTEMRLGGTIEHQGAALEFVRVKARKSLLNPAGTVLADSALATFLAGVDRSFFDQMFGLDHARLETGGKAILSASNDIGQILFQSAAGIGSLGTVRDQLEVEADKLWAHRRSGDRAYYIASDELARADAALKAATVRTKAWMEARDKVQELEERRERLRNSYLGFEAERIRFERVRRVASALRILRDRQAELQQLGEVVLLPPDAAQQLAEIELVLAGAERDQQLYAGQAQQVRERLEVIRPDRSLLKHEADILALTERRQQVRNHERDIDRRQLEITMHWQRVETLLSQLGWPAAAEDKLSHELPALPARSVLAGLVKRFGVLDQACRTAVAAVTERTADMQTLDVQLKGLAVSTVPATLRTALTSARGLGDLKAATRRDEALVSKKSRELATAVAALGPLPPDLVTLRGLMLPSEQDIRLRQKRHTDAQTTRKALADKHIDSDASISALELEITQYRNAHHPVSLTELAEVRAERDAIWYTIKSGEQPARELATAFEAKLSTADRVADRRHDKAREVSELQSKLDALERLKQQAAENKRRQTENEAECASIDTDWAQLTAAIGMAGLPLHEFEPWRAAREKALLAEDALIDTQRTLSAAQQTAQAAAAALSTALTGAGIVFENGAAFETQMLIASDAVDAATEAKARLDEINKQRELAAAALARQSEKAETAQAEFDAWSSAWRSATANCGLPATTDVAAADGSLNVIAEIDEKLRSIRDIRKARIETMQHDLNDFEHKVAALVSAAAPDLSEQNASAAITELSARLTKALDEKKESNRLRDELKEHEGQAKSANDRVAKARATVLPLLQLAQVSSHDDLRSRIALSDRRRLIEAAATAAQKAVEEGGDGLALEALEAEMAAIDIAQMSALMADVVRQLESVRQEQEALASELTTAHTQLDRIAGQDDAARAESERQDALAKMANAADRYIKVYTASRLLKWAIDRYREDKQGPMLTRAGEIFSAVTLGSFQKLTVDFESEPPALYGLRAGGGAVGIAGMSDGTHDLLYLALRLAALELHLGQGHALPFIADDLFIKYDNRRAKAGLEALASLSEKTQVIFLSHHDHLVPTVQAVFGRDVNIVTL